MKNNLQTIINACFVISITAFIYQNNAQQDRIEVLEKESFSNAEYYQLSTNPDFNLAVQAVVTERCEVIQPKYSDVLYSLYCR
tara:strand:+ start:2666 stop:2914 length:249 start_codon:yes stop_codon:yes gene_type:complete